MRHNQTGLLSEKLPLRLLSEIAGEEFESASDLITRFNPNRPTPWVEIAKTHAILKGTLGLSDAQATDQAIVAAVDQLIEHRGLGLDEVRSRDEPFAFSRYVAVGLKYYLEKQFDFLLSAQWNASVAGADAGVSVQFWPAQVWMMRTISGGEIPDRPVTDGELGALTLQSNDLAFLGHLSDEEISFLRSHRRLAEMRNMVSGEHLRLRSDIGRAATAARECGDRFISRLDEYELQLREQLAGRRTSSSLLLEQARQDAGQLALTTVFGFLGLIAAPPWSFIVTAASVLFGGQSIVGLRESAKKEAEREEMQLKELQESPLSVCLSARQRASRASD